MIKKGKFRYFALGNFIEKQAKKQVDALKSSNLFNKIDKLYQIKKVFPGNFVKKKTIPGNENPDKVISIVEKLIDFNKQ